MPNAHKIKASDSWVSLALKFRAEGWDQRPVLCEPLRVGTALALVLNVRTLGRGWLVLGYVWVSVSASSSFSFIGEIS